MKRLLDESTDELTRSLLVAGIEHRPPPGNKQQVIVAIGAGGAFGLLSSNAAAWLGTTAGKVTAAGVAIGVAGAVLVAAPVWRSSPEDTARATARLSAAPARAEARAPSDDAPTEALGPASDAPSGAALASEPGVVTPVSPGQPGADPSAAEQQRASSGSEVRSGAKKKRHAARGRSGKRRLRAERRKQALAVAEPAGSASAESAEAEKARLDAEVRLVDDMHWAARRDDREALARFVQRYRESFPSGQLKDEVEEFAARLERNETP